MARVEVTVKARRDLDGLLADFPELPADTRQRVRELIEPLTVHPEMGTPIGSPFADYRFLVGMWRWLLVVYRFDVERDTVYIEAFQDSRRRDAVTSTGEV